MKFRKEFDSIGKINVQNDKYWGASTERSKKFFDIGEIYVQKILIKSIADQRSRFSNGIGKTIFFAKRRDSRE